MYCVRCFVVVMFFQALLFGGLLTISPEGSQRELFSRDDKTFFTDYYVPRGWLTFESWFDDKENPCNYLPFGFEFLRPFSPDRNGAIIFLALSSVLYLVCLFAFARSVGYRRRTAICIVGAIVPSWIFLRTLERGNTIFVAASLTCLFFAWFDSSNKWKRGLAALALGAASAMKIAPAFLGCLYFVEPLRDVSRSRRLDWVSMFVCGISAVIFFLAPFFWAGDGLSDIRTWFGNAGASAVGFPSTWGLSGIYVYASGVLSNACPWLTEGACRSLTFVLGGVLLLVFALMVWLRKPFTRSDKLFMVVALMLILSPNSQFYMGLLLFPSLFLWLHEIDAQTCRSGVDYVQLFLWGLMLMVVQIPVGGKSITVFITFVAFWSLIAIKISKYALPSVLK